MSKTDSTVTIAPDPYYAPNQQVVRPDGSGPAEEGAGGSEHTDPDPKEEEEPAA